MRLRHLNVEEKYIPYLTTDHTKYVEVYILVDHPIVSIWFQEHLKLHYLTYLHTRPFLLTKDILYLSEKYLHGLFKSDLAPEIHQIFLYDCVYTFIKFYKQVCIMTYFN